MDEVIITVENYGYASPVGEPATTAGFNGINIDVLKVGHLIKRINRDVEPRVFKVYKILDTKRPGSLGKIAMVEFAEGTTMENIPTKGDQFVIEGSTV